MFANSGLYCIEQEIVLFAEKYSAYNKCHQLEALLRRIIEITSGQIKEKEEDCRQHKAALEQALEDDKAKLLSNLDVCGGNIQEESIDAYPLEVANGIKPEQWFKSIDELEERESALCGESLKEHGFDEESEQVEEAKKAVGDNFGKRISDAFSAPSLDAFGEAFKGLASDIDDTKAKYDKARATERDAEIEMSEKLLEEVKREFNDRLGEISATIDKQSREYWESRSESGRDVIYQLATNSTVLSEEKRKEIADIIIQYPALSLEVNTDEIFDKSNFDRLRLFNILFYQSTRLNLNKVVRTFNGEVETALEAAKGAIRSSHEASFKEWLTILLGKIKDNITEYNPVLNRHVKLINDDEKMILELTKKLDTLQRCTENVARMIDWR